MNTKGILANKELQKREMDKARKTMSVGEKAKLRHAGSLQELFATVHNKISTGGDEDEKASAL